MILVDGNPEWLEGFDGSEAIDWSCTENITRIDPKAEAYRIECLRAAYDDPAFCERRRQHFLAIRGTYEARAEQAERMRAEWLDPVIRAKRTAAISEGQKRRHARARELQA